MQSTDLDALAEQMIQEPDITSEDDNPSEAVEAQSEHLMMIRLTWTPT